MSRGGDFKTSTVGPSEYTSRIIRSSANEVSITKDWKAPRPLKRSDPQIEKLIQNYLVDEILLRNL